MNKSKFRRSIARFNQNTSEVSQHLAFLPLLTLPEKGGLQVLPQGLAVIEEQAAGRTFLVAVYGRSSALINALYRNNNLLQDDRAESGAWVASYPRYDYQNHRQFLFLHVHAKLHEHFAILHAYCATVCSAVVVDLADLPSLDFLAAMPTRVVFSAAERNEATNRSERRREVANLVLLRRSKAKEPSSEMRRSSRELQEALVAMGVGEVMELHRSVVLLRVSSDAFEGESPAYLSRLEEELQETVSNNNKNEDLRNGPVLREYAELVGQALGRSGSVDIQASTAAIRISQGYHAFTRAVEAYHGQLRRDLREEGVANIREVLREAREEALEEFKRESNDAGYLLRITEHIEQTEEKLVQENNKALDLRNLAFLRQASEGLLGKLAAGKVAGEQAQAEIDAIVGEYKAQAHGDNRYEILTNYLSILHTAVGKNLNVTETTALRKELQTVRRERDGLEMRLEQVRRENSGKCCEIM